MNIKDVARKIGVSPYTVSCAIRNRGELSAETRQRVLEQVRELGYIPNINGQRLVQGRSRLIAFDDRRPGLFSDIFAMQLARGLQYALQKRGYSLLLNTADEHGEANTQLKQWVRSRTVDGVVLVGHVSYDSLVREIATPSTPCIVMDTLLEGIPNVASVMKGRAGERQVARLFAEQGHRRIGFLDEPQIQQKPNDVLEAFAGELQSLGIPLESRYLLSVPNDPASGAEGMRALMTQNPRPTAVFVRTDAMALGALREARNLGLRVPEDVSLAGHDDLPLAEFAEPPLTTVRIDCGMAGDVVTDALFHLLEEPGAMQTWWFETSLVVRQSVGPAPRP